MQLNSWSLERDGVIEPIGRGKMGRCGFFSGGFYAVFWSLILATMASRQRLQIEPRFEAAVG